MINKLANKYEIDQTRYAIEKTKTNGVVCLEELDIILPKDTNFEGYDMKKLIAFKITGERKNNRYNRDIIGEIDMEIAPNVPQKIVNLDGYAAIDSEIMELLFRFLENRSITHGANTIRLNDALGNGKIAFLTKKGYKEEPSKYPSISDLTKEGLEKQTFNGTLEDLDKEVKAIEDASEK